MRSRLGTMALAPIGLMLASCTPPPRATLSITNDSGQRLSFMSCRGEAFVLEPGARVELTDIYMMFHPEVHWSCYTKKPLVLRTAQGSWTYSLRPVYDYKKGPGITVEQFSNPKPPPDVVPLERRYFIEIEPGGSIRAGRPGGEGGVEFPADTQPRGFPLIPQK